MWLHRVHEELNGCLMRRNQALLLTLSLLILLLSSDYVKTDSGPTPIYGRYATSLHCNREPPGVTGKKTPGDNGFKIKIVGNPEKYTPGEVYTVVLQGYKTLYSVLKFTAFMLVVEPRDWPDDASSGSTGTPQLPDVGMFQLFGDALTKISEDCPNGIVHASNIPKSEIQIMWNSPSPGSGCVVFKATVVEHRDIYYMDDGGLTKVLCEEETESLDEQPEVLEECCACDEAKYEVIFEGLWSKYTHPKDFPANFWLTHFSDIIGASHSADFRMWEYGGYSSEGLRQVAELGVTKKLEAELKAESNKIRTIIKARGLWHPNLNGKTFAVFRVDRKHHLMSLVSMLGPSPDWIVGVSALELCFKNCSWIAEKVMNLYLWDAGTDSGITYLSPNQPTIPQERIRRITSSQPNHNDSPFFESTGAKMKPFARLTVTRQRMYEKPCEDIGNEVHPRNPENADNEDERPECQVTEFTQWSACSATCGQGIRMRTRNYIHEQKARMTGCTTTLIEKDMCEADCVGDVSCATTSWQDWTECSVTCGKGYRSRKRNFMNRMARKVCGQVDLVEKEPCMGVLTECTEVEEIDPKCSVTQWSEWSPCTVTCGKGIKARTRLYMSPGSISICNVELIQKAPCVADKLDCTVDLTEAKEVCMMPKEVGPCRGYFPRWYYDVGKGMCLQFIYGGCRGNKNNFERYNDCNRMCEVMLRDFVRAPLPPSTIAYAYAMKDATVHLEKGLVCAPISALTTLASNSMSSSGSSGSPNFQSSGQSAGALPGHSGGDQPVIDCVVTPWSEWSPCTRTCGTGRRERRRQIKLSPQNGGKQCPKKLVQRRRCKDNPPCLKDCILSEWSDWSDCSSSCGVGGIMYRQRDLRQINENGGVPCGPKIERKYCTNLPPCV